MLHLDTQARRLNETWCSRPGTAPANQPRSGPLRAAPGGGPVRRPERAQEDGVDVVVGDREAAEGIVAGDAPGAEPLDADQEIDALQLGAEVVERLVQGGPVAGSRHARTCCYRGAGAGYLDAGNEP